MTRKVLISVPYMLPLREEFRLRLESEAVEASATSGEPSPAAPALSG